MRAYTASSQEALRARSLLKDWAGEGFLTESQCQRMLDDTALELRCTNIFLRLVLFLFTVLIVAAATGLFFMASRLSLEAQSTGIFLLIFAAISYAAAEFAVSSIRLYRHGIEEALAVSAVVFLCLGLQALLFSGGPYSPTPKAMEFVVPGGGAIASLVIWYRFGLSYGFLAAMIFVLLLPGYWTSSNSTQRVIVAALYAAGLVVVCNVRPSQRLTYLNRGYSIVEAFLWLGIYLGINLRLWSADLVGQWWKSSRTAVAFSPTFYWATWVLIWCLPAVILLRGIRQRDRFVIGAGAIAGILTLVTNKPYLGWQRHTWDPMLLGALLIGIALLVRRWLAHRPGEVRHGFTARRLSGKDKRWMNVGSAALGLGAAHATTHTPQTGSHEVHFGGGDFGGGGASSDF